MTSIMGAWRWQWSLQEGLEQDPGQEEEAVVLLWGSGDDSSFCVTKRVTKRETRLLPFSGLWPLLGEG